MPLLGHPLDAKPSAESKFSLKTTLMLTDQIIDRIEYVHSKGILHRYSSFYLFSHLHNDIACLDLYDIEVLNPTTSAWDLVPR